MMNFKIVTLISVFAVLFGSGLCEASNLQLSVFGSSSIWWLAVAPVDGSLATSTIELQQSGSSVWTTMEPNAGWGYWQLASTVGSSGFHLPLSFRLTASNGEQLVLTSILTTVTPGDLVNTNTQYASAATQESGHHNNHMPTEHATHAPTRHPTQAPTHHATAAPTQHATAAPTQHATAAPTQHATAAPTQHATAAPTQHATAAPTQHATAAPTQHATAAPTQKPTQAPTQHATAAPTQKPTQKPTSAPSGNLCAVTPTSSEPMKLMVPLYIYPGSTWTQVIQAAQSGVEVLAIINPNNGPESSGPDSAYTSYMAQLTAAGVTMVGYIHTLYGDRAIADVVADITTYATKYPGLKGIFVDECATSANDLAYYQQVYNAILSHSGYTNAIINPGTQPDQGYMDVSTNIVVFESKANQWTGNLFSSWVACAPSAAEKAGYKYRFSAIAMNAAQTSLTTLLTDFESSGIGYVYVTDGLASGNTYGTLPTYFTAEVAAIKADN